MKLIGMLDSPYVRRVAVSLQLLGLDFEHEPLSVFRNFDEFRGINPVVKAPTLVCDGGEVLMDSTLILQYAESLAQPRSLVPREPYAALRDLRVTGLALAAAEKSIQIYYEHTLRPAEKQHAPWLDRVTVQLREALVALESELAALPMPADEGHLTQGRITAAVTWGFVRKVLPAQASPSDYPALDRLSSDCEQLPVFRAAALGPGRYPVKA